MWWLARILPAHNFFLFLFLFASHCFWRQIFLTQNTLFLFQIACYIFYLIGNTRQSFSLNWRGILSFELTINLSAVLLVNRWWMCRTYSFYPGFPKEQIGFEMLNREAGRLLKGHLSFARMTLTFFKLRIFFFRTLFVHILEMWILLGY